MLRVRLVSSVMMLVVVIIMVVMMIGRHVNMRAK
jgi:hypothetical protein